MGADERRIGPRVTMHSIAKISDSDPTNYDDYYGYIENLSAFGIGVVSPDVIPEGVKMECTFFMEGIARKLSPVATVVHTRATEETKSYYYGFRFDEISESDRVAIMDYIMGKQYS